MPQSDGLDFSFLHGEARSQLLDILDRVRGRKNLVLEECLAGFINLFVKASTLQEHGVDKFFFLENDQFDASQKEIVFIASGEKSRNAIRISEHIQRLRKSLKFHNEFTVIWLPRRTLVSDNIFQEFAVLGDITIEILPILFLPLEQDVASLCQPDCFQDLYVHQDSTSIYLAAKGLMRIQQTFGLFPHIYGKGDAAHRLAELLFQMRLEDAVAENGHISSQMPSVQIDSLIIIDRVTDLLTPFLTQLTYEGLIDEIFGIENGEANIDVLKLSSSQNRPVMSSTASGGTTKAKSKMRLDSLDALYQTIRDANFAVVDGLLSKAARQLQSDMQSRHDAKSTKELRDFVGKLPALQVEQQNLKSHIAIAEELLKDTQSDTFRQCLNVQQSLVDGSDPASEHESVENLIARNTDLYKILRLLCLESCVSGGLRQKDLDHFKLLFLQAYGYQHLLTFAALEKSRCLQIRNTTSVLFNPLGTASGSTEESKTNYNYLRKPLNLVVDGVNEQNPDDVSYAYSGYAPLSVRLVQMLLQRQMFDSFLRGQNSASMTSSSANEHGWQGFESILANVKGKTVSRSQKGHGNTTKARNGLLSTKGANGQNNKTTVVMYLGGITFAEIAALRYINKQMEQRQEGRKIMICTTGIINGNGIIDAMLEKKDFSKA